MLRSACKKYYRKKQILSTINDKNNHYQIIYKTTKKFQVLKLQKHEATTEFQKIQHICNWMLHRKLWLAKLKI